MRENGFDDKLRLEHMKSVASMDRIVYSTEWLRDYYHHELRKAFGKRRLPDMVVCRNHVFEDDWPIVEDYDGPARVGWMGSPSHVWDVKLAWPALMYAKYNGARTFMVGYDPADPAEHGESEASLEAQAQWRKVGYETVPWRKMSGTERLRLPFDIGLCPLVTEQLHARQVGHQSGRDDDLWCGGCGAEQRCLQPGLGAWRNGFVGPVAFR